MLSSHQNLSVSASPRKRHQLETIQTGVSKRRIDIKAERRHSNYPFVIQCRSSVGKDGTRELDQMEGKERACPSSRSPYTAALEFNATPYNQTKCKSELLVLTPAGSVVRRALTPKPTGTLDISSLPGYNFEGPSNKRQRDLRESKSPARPSARRLRKLSGTPGRAWRGSIESGTGMEELEREYVRRSMLRRSSDANGSSSSSGIGNHHRQASFVARPSRFGASTKENSPYGFSTDGTFTIHPSMYIARRRNFGWMNLVEPGSFVDDAELDVALPKSNNISGQETLEKAQDGFGNDDASTAPNVAVKSESGPVLLSHTSHKNGEMQQKGMNDVEARNEVAETKAHGTTSSKEGMAEDGKSKDTVSLFPSVSSTGIAPSGKHGGDVQSTINISESKGLPSGTEFGTSTTQATAPVFQFGGGGTTQVTASVSRETPTVSFTFGTTPSTGVNTGSTNLACGVGSATQKAPVFNFGGESSSHGPVQPVYHEPFSFGSSGGFSVGSGKSSSRSGSRRPARRALRR